MSSLKKTVIDTSCRVTVAHDMTYQAVVSGHMDLVLDFDRQQNGRFHLEIVGGGQMNLTLNFSSGSNFQGVILNNTEESLMLKESVFMDEGAEVHLNYGFFSDGDHEIVSNYHLQGRHSQMTLRSASIINNRLNWEQNINHDTTDTSALIKNYGVVFEGGFVQMDVNGIIHPACHRSKSFQESRIMNMAPTIVAKVNPKLVIDDNDVEAGHAASVGQPDKESIYYMESRGLSREETLRLMTLGYLLPVVDAISNEEIREELHQKITDKVASL